MFIPNNEQVVHTCNKLSGISITKRDSKAPAVTVEVKLLGASARFEDKGRRLQTRSFDRKSVKSIPVFMTNCDISIYSPIYKRLWDIRWPPRRQSYLSKMCMSLYTTDWTTATALCTVLEPFISKNVQRRSSIISLLAPVALTLIYTQVPARIATMMMIDGPLDYWK